MKKRELESLENESQSSSNWSKDLDTKPKFDYLKAAKSKVPVAVNRALLSKKPENLLNYEMTSDISTDGGLDVSGNCHGKLCGIVDKLQDQDW